MTDVALNVLGTELVPCSYDPLTGYFRDGCCHTDMHDLGSHLVCAKVTDEFCEKLQRDTHSKQGDAKRESTQPL